MKTFNLSRERKARVWIDGFQSPFSIDQLSLPIAAAASADCVGNMIPVRSAVVVELFIPAGARFFYGMLGVQLLGVESRRVKIEIAKIPQGQQVGVEDSLAGALDAVVPWIDDEYHGAILSGAEEAAKNYFVLPEIVRVCSGRQGFISSSADLFRRLAFIGVTLMATPEEDIGWKLEELIELR